MLIDVDALADEVAELCRRLDAAESGREASDCTTLTEDRQRLREIGELAHQHGGTELMGQLVYVASWNYRNTVDTTDVHWRGIGGGQQ
ncbi:hypothetical protein [Nitrococcus mobilis]|uniref:Uncharacterized protein n=1 Tax=Nitrococcus mobilis Nb-231 TaxID=314278 RepID=A4BNM5_9GAMM|nr:hypothetical protein [Nitrococcus mobilis]EAR22824.1 hypothetical protein NB231_10238 [Nitrococcus mobilis Nb-231]